MGLGKCRHGQVWAWADVGVGLTAAAGGRTGVWAGGRPAVRGSVGRPGPGVPPCTWGEDTGHGG